MVFCYYSVNNSPDWIIITMKRNIIIITLLMFSASLTGCGKAPTEETVLVSIGETNITVSDFNERIANLPPRYKEIIVNRKDEYLEELINNTLLYQEAVRQGLDKDNDVLRVIEEAKKKIIIARLLEDKVDRTIEVTDEDVKAYYDAHKDEYMTPEVMRASHILVPTRSAAELIVDELAKGEKFDDLARAKSIDPTAQKAGDVGYFPKGQLMPEWDNACSKLKVGQTSGVVRTSLGYHIIKLTDRRSPQSRPIDQVADNIKAKVSAQKRQSLFDELLDKLRKKTPVEINKRALSASGNVAEKALETKKEDQ